MFDKKCKIKRVQNLWRFFEKEKCGDEKIKVHTESHGKTVRGRERERESVQV
jgi:hypothetical protein